jgi:hypothetical protein
LETKKTNESIFQITQDCILNKTIEKELTNLNNICDSKMELANEGYYLVDKNIKKLQDLIEMFEQELINSKFNDFSYQNSLLDNNYEELLNFDLYLNSNKNIK